MLLVFSLCFIGCKPADNDPKVDIILDGKYFAEVIYNNPYISDPTNSSKITIENNKIYDHEFIEYELQGDFFVSTNDIYKDVFTPIKDIEKIWFAEIVMPDDVDVETKEEIIELIKELEKLPFIKSAEPNYIEHTC